MVAPKCDELTDDRRIFHHEIFSQEHVSDDQSYEILQLDQYIMDDTDEWWINIEDIVQHIEDQGTWAREAFTALSVAEQEALGSDIGDFVLNLVNGLQEVRAERDPKKMRHLFTLPNFVNYVPGISILQCLILIEPN